MKRIVIDRFGSTLNLIQELGLRPSFERRVKDDCFNKNILKVRELCMKDEEELLKIPSFNSRFVSQLKAVLADYGLRFGMSEAELDSYMDQDYLESLGMDKSFNGSKSVSRVVLKATAEPAASKPDVSEFKEETAPGSSSDKVKEAHFTETTFVAASFVGCVMGYSLVTLLELIVKFISDLF